MGNLVSRFEKAIQRINILYGLLAPVALGLIFGRSIAIANPDFFKTDPLATTIYLSFLIIGLVLVAIHIRSHGRLSKIAIALLYAFYHVGLGMYVIFIDPYPTPFYFQIIALLIAVDLVFGKRWLYASISYFTLIIYTAYLRQATTVDAEGIIVALTYIVGAASVGLLVSKYRQVSDEERKQLEEATHQNAFERQRLLSLINNMGDAVMATDDKGKVLLYNAAVLNLLDTNQSLEGKSVSKILNIVDKKGHKVDVFKKITEKQLGLTSSDYRHQFNKDDSINLYMNISPIKLGFKEHTQSGYIFIMRDITREKSLEEERDEFISVISHELRTPVTIAEGNLSNAIYMNKAKKDSKVVAQSLDQAHDQVVFLAGMLNDLSSLSRAERTDDKLQIEKVDPAQLVHSLQSDYHEDAENKGLKYVTTAAKDTKPIFTSQLYLHEILQNFVTNALKYTKKGSVIVHVRSDKQGNAVFSVADTGIGLSKADQKKVFEKFFRSEDYRTRESSGTGLGLYVTQKLAHRLKAVIALESELNKGSTFTITVPSLKDHKK